MSKNILNYNLRPHGFLHYLLITMSSPPSRFEPFLKHLQLDWLNKSKEMLHKFYLCKEGRARLCKLEEGFTLIEMVILLGILSTILLPTIIFQQDFFKINRLVEGSLSRETEARRLLVSFANEVRSASPSSIGSFLIEQAAIDSFIFFADIDGDGLKERIRYFLNGNILKKGVLKPSISPVTYDPANEVIKDLIREVNPGAIFLYYDSTYDGTNAPLTQPVDVSKIRLVRATVTIDVNGPKPPEPISVSVQAVIRDLRFQ